METTLIPYFFFGLLAFAALISIINAFRDDNNDRRQHRDDRGQHPTHPDQGRYDDYGQNRPIIIYTNYPDPNYGRPDHSTNGPKPFWSNAIIFIALFGGLIYWFSGKNGTAMNQQGIVASDEIKKEQPQPPTDRLQTLVGKKYPQTSPSEKTVLTESDLVQPHPEQWYTVVSVYNSKNAAKEAMNTVAATIDLNGKTIYYGKTNLNHWMVYIPVSSEKEAKVFVKEINYYQEELQSFCPDQPEVLHLD